MLKLENEPFSPNDLHFLHECKRTEIFKQINTLARMNPTFKTVARPNVPTRPKNCYLCDAIVQTTHIRNVDQLFYEDPHKNAEQSKSLATILSDILEQSIEESTVHSRIVCRKCQQMCAEYDRLALRMHELRQNITNNFNETANKYSLKVIEMDPDMEHNYEGDDINIQNMYAIESVDSTIGEVFNNENEPSKTTQMKKVMLIKAENGSNPFFTISDIVDDQAIHCGTVSNIYLRSKHCD